MNFYGVLIDKDMSTKETNKHKYTKEVNMAKKSYLSLLGLQKYDAKIKNYITTSIDNSEPDTVTKEQINSLFMNSDTSGSLNTITVIPEDEIDNLWDSV